MATNRYCIDIAKRGTAGCKNCKTKIEKGVVRIGKITPNPFTESGGDMKQWYHSRCIFEALSRARATTKKIEAPDDLEGWDEIDDDSKEEVLKYIREFSTSSAQPKSTPKKSTPKKTETEKTEKQAAAKTTEQPKEKSTKNSDECVDSKDNSLRVFRKLCSKIAEESSSLKKTEIVSDFFSKGSDGNGFKGNLYLWIKLLLPDANKRVYNVQSKQLIKLFSEIFKASHEEMLEDLEKGDVAETIYTFFETSEDFPPTKKSSLTLYEVDEFLDSLTKVSRELDQSKILTKVAKRCTSNDLKMFIRFIKHDLRIKAGIKPILTAIHPAAYEAFQASRNLEDIVNRALESKGSSQLSVKSTLMTPVLPMLAMACHSVDEAFQRFPDGFYVELKYDGERVQLHKKGQEFSYFSRSLKPVMPHKVNHFKDFIPQAFPHGNSLILDCEILLVNKDGKPLPFGTLGAHKKTAFQDANVCLFVFDCLQYNDENLMKKPLVERKSILEKNMTAIKNHIMFSEMKEINDPEELTDIMMSVINQGLEGLVIKSKKSLYEPGKRHWLKVKKDYLAKGKKGKKAFNNESSSKMVDTADLIVLGAYYGTGEKGGMMSIFLMGCHNPKTDKFYTVTKVHGGFTDSALADLQDSLKMKKISKDFSKIPSWLVINKSLTPDFVSENPKDSPVWEITGAEFSKAEAHTANGVSIRFPRVTRVRDDKTWKEATNVQELHDLYVASKQTSEIIGLSPVKKSKGESSNIGSKSPHQEKKQKSEDNRKNKITSVKKKSSPDNEVEKRPLNTEKMTKASKNKVLDDAAVSPAKKLRKENDSSCSSSASVQDESTPSSEILPDVFSGLKLYIPESLDKADLLRRYFVAYDGQLLSDCQKNEANLALEEYLQNSSLSVKKVSTDWLWACIKLKKKLPTHLYSSRSDQHAG